MIAIERMINQAVDGIEKKIVTSDHIDVDPGEWFFDDERDPTLTEWMDRVDARLSRLENLMMGKVLD